MERLTITDKKLINALRRMAPETGSLICLGCGYERRCSVHGCAVLQAAVGRLEELTAPQPNDPLTLEQLREMDGEPVWISYFAGGPNVCMLVDAKHDVCRDTHGGFAVFENLGRTWLAYRRKPEEGTWQQ